MHRLPLLQMLESHQPLDKTEAEMHARTIKFVRDQAQCFDRSLMIGHVTGSAWVVNENFDHALLIHHAKLDRWFQPGGHCDGDANVLAVAMREAHEETGLLSLQVVNAQVFDVDVHWIPERSTHSTFVAGHWHYDIRFLLRANIEEELVINAEIKALRWVNLNQIKKIGEPSLRRMALKTSL